MITKVETAKGILNHAKNNYSSTKFNSLSPDYNSKLEEIGEIGNHKLALSESITENYFVRKN